MIDATDSPPLEKRYDSFRDASGAWAFDVADYRRDLASIAPVEVDPDPTPREAYRTAVFLEGFIESHRNAGNWSDAALAEFEAFDSTLEAEAVARALRGIAADAEARPELDAT